MPITIARFDHIDWKGGQHPLERKKVATSALTMLEFAVGFCDPNHCVRGHVGFVVEGELAFVAEGAEQRVRAGEGFEIEPGTEHRALNPGSVPVRLFIYTF